MVIFRIIRMKPLHYLILFLAIMNYAPAQNQPESIDLAKFSGKWYVIGVIPTRFDKNWNYVTETYTLNKKGTIDIYTTYIKIGETKTESVKSKGFPNKAKNNVMWKVQFVWPFRADYLIEEVDKNYIYTVVGHPKKKFLYIMNRTGKMDEALYNALAKKYADKGYDISKLRKLLQ